MAKYILTKKSTDDLRNIWNYTLNKWSEAQAYKYISQIKIELEKLASEGIMFDREYYETKEGLYGRPCNKHIIFYTINSNRDIKIIRILHQMMDYKNKL